MRSTDFVIRRSAEGTTGAPAVDVGPRCSGQRWPRSGWPCCSAWPPSGPGRRHRPVARVGTPGGRSPTAQVTSAPATAQSVDVPATTSRADRHCGRRRRCVGDDQAAGDHGPAFATTIVEPAVWPGTMGEASAVLLMDTSALGLSVVVLNGLLLSAGSGSGVDDDTVAAFSNEVPEGGVDRRRHCYDLARGRRPVADRHGADVALHRPRGDRADCTPPKSWRGRRPDRWAARR